MLSIIKAAIINYVRNRKTVIFNFLFPVFLVVLLGVVLSNNMKSEVTVNDEGIEVMYLNEGDEKADQILNVFKENEDAANIKLVEEESLEKGKEAVRLNEAAFIYFNEDKIEFYSNSNNLIESSTAYSMLKSIVNRFNAAEEIVSVNLQNAESILSGDEESAEEVFNISKIETEKTPTAMGYYGVLELGLMVFYFVSFPLFHMEEERKNNIKDRVILSGLSSTKYYIGSFIGYTLISYISILMSYLTLRYIFNVNYGDSIFIVPLALLPFIALVNIFGILLAIIFKNAEKTDVILSAVIIPVMCFLGGGYLAFIGDDKSMFNTLTLISPLRWFGKGVLNSIYINDYSYLKGWLVISLSAIAVMVVSTIAIAKKEERYVG